MSSLAHIVALGAHTAVGRTAEASAAAVRAGISRMALHPFMVDAEGEPLRAAQAAGLSSDYLGLDRMVAMARHALFEVIAKLSLHSLAGGRPVPLPVVLVLPEPRPGFDAQAAAYVQRQLSGQPLAGVPLEVTLGPRGHAGGLAALAELAGQIAQGRLEMAVVCGVDSYLAPDTLDWLESFLQVRRPGTRGGFPLGEGAGAVLLAGPVARGRHRWTSLASLRATGVAQEAVTLKSGGDGLGRGLTQALQAALSQLRLPEEAADHAYVDLNGERYRSEEWGFALLRAGAGLRHNAFSLAVDSWGDVGAAWGPLSCALGCGAFSSRFSPGPRCVLVGGSESGLRAAVVLEAEGRT